MVTVLKGQGSLRKCTGSLCKYSRYKEILSDSLGHCQLGKTLIQSTDVKSKFKVNYK